MGSRKLMFTMLLSIMALLIVTACSGNTVQEHSNATQSQNQGETKSESPSQSETSKDPIVLGVVTPLSGPYALFGNSIANSIELAVEQANSKGGLLDGRMVEIIKEDSEAKPNVALSKTERLALNEKVNLFIGTLTTAEIQAVGSNLEAWNSMMVATGAKSLAIINPVNPNLFRTTYNDVMEINIFKEWLTTSDVKDAKSFYALGADYAWGHDQVTRFKEYIEAEVPGAVLHGEAFTPLGTTDFSAQLNKIASIKPEVVFTAIAAGDLINLLNQASELGLTETTQFFTFFGRSVVAQTPNAVGVAGSVMYDISVEHPKNAEYVKAYREKFNTEPDDLAGHAYVGAVALLNAIEAAGSTETAAVIEAMKATEFESIVGDVKMNTETNELILPGFAGETVKDPSTGKAALKIVTNVSPEKLQPWINK